MEVWRKDEVVFVARLGFVQLAAAEASALAPHFACKLIDVTACTSLAALQGCRLPFTSSTREYCCPAPMNCRRSNLFQSFEFPRPNSHNWSRSDAFCILPRELGYAG